MDKKEERRQRVRRAAKFLRYVLRVLSGMLLFVFGWLRLKDFPIVAVLGSAEALSVLRWTIVIYFSSWVAGSEFDLSMRESIYIKPPPNYVLGWLVPPFVVLSVVFGVLCWLVDTPSQFAAFLLLFWCLNGLTWFVARSKVFPVLHELDDENQPDRKAAMAMLMRYDVGSWQAYRFFVGALILTAVNVTAHYALNQYFGVMIGWPADLVFAATMLAFVLSLETWIWWERGKAYLALSTVQWLGEHFHIGPEKSEPGAA